jgi:RNA polymerase sigma factor (sigma-70 family)
VPGERTDAELLVAFARGDRSAMDALVGRLDGSLRKLLGKLHGTRDPDALDDLSQRVWFQAIRSAARYDSTCSVTTWLCAIARNDRSDLRKHGKHRTLVPLGDADEDVAARGLAPGDRCGLSGDLADVMAELPPEERQVVLLAKIEGHTLEDISQKTGVPMSTPHDPLKRGVSWLRTKLAPWSPDRGEREMGKAS